jgi:hypothetical protein
MEHEPKNNITNNKKTKRALKGEKKKKKMRSLTCASLAATVTQHSASARSQGSQIVDSIHQEQQ